MVTKAVYLKDLKFHKRLISMKNKHGFSSVEKMLKGWEKVYKIYLRELTNHSGLTSKGVKVGKATDTPALRSTINPGVRK